MVLNLTITSMLVVAELFGALIYLKTKDTFMRMLLSCLGLGFLIAVLFADILPDATEDFSNGYYIFIFGALIMCGILYGIRRYGEDIGDGKYIGNYTAVLGMGFHNFCEGVVITALSSITPILIVGVVLHKLPEGMVSFSLLEGLKDRTRFIVAALIALLIPLGAFIPISEDIAQPTMAFGAGVILVVVSRSLIQIVAEHYRSGTPNIAMNFTKIAAATAVGVIFGVVSCLIV